MIVVAWDHNKAFDVDVRGEEGLDPQSSNNALVRRFRGIDRFEDEYVMALADLTREMYSSGLIDAVLDRLATLLRTSATDLVDSASVDASVSKILDIAELRRGSAP